VSLLRGKHYVHDDQAADRESALQVQGGLQLESADRTQA
jgi:hypothetical protein